MNRFLFISLSLLFFSCSSNSSKTASKNDAKDSVSTKSMAVWPKEEENEFISGCIEGLRGKLPEDSAYMRCNCVLQQLKQKFPNMDSASAFLMDTAKAAAFAANCK